MEIHTTILGLMAFTSLKLTHIMQGANISYSKVKEDVTWLTRKGLLEERSDVSGERCFRTTAEGLQLLADYKRIAEKLL